MTCVSTVCYSVHFNGVPSHSFSPSRGLRQGDPLSPYLFLLVVDGLSSLLRRYESVGQIGGLKICRHAPSITHLLFVDDSLLFFRVNQVQATVVKHTLTIFERCTGQQLSPSKCSLFMSENAQEGVRNQIREILRVQSIDFKAKYLGLPTPMGRLKRGVFQPLEERFHKRMTALKEKELSVARKEVLIKSVAQALPNNVISVFMLPVTLCDNLMKHIRAYWRGSKNGCQKVQWVPWERMIMPKGFGGMGFRDLRLVNQALLARQAWWLIFYPKSLSTEYC